MSYNPNKTPRLNYFILWCKGWYKPTDKNIPLVEEVKKVLALDEYICCRNMPNVLHIVSTFVDELNEYYKTIGESPFNHEKLIRSIYENMRYGFNYEEALLMSYRSFIAFELMNKDVTLKTPIYSKALRKKGFIHDYKHGMTYKEANRYAKNFFSKSINQ